jgi:hypothetical protein
MLLVALGYFLGRKGYWMSAFVRAKRAARMVAKMVMPTCRRGGKDVAKFATSL